MFCAFGVELLSRDMPKSDMPLPACKNMSSIGGTRHLRPLKGFWLFLGIGKGVEMNLCIGLAASSELLDCDGALVLSGAAFT